MDVSQIPVYFPRCLNRPAIKVNIENRQYLMMLDLGCNGHLDLFCRVLNDLKQKEFVGVSTFIDIKGNQYEHQKYRIPFLKLGSFTISDATAGEENDLFIREGARIGTWNDPLRLQDRIDTIDGRIGGGLFCDLQCVCYFDMSRLIFCMQSSLDRIMESYPLTDFVKGSFEIVNGWACLNIQTDRGMKRFVLDTGASHSIIQKSSLDRQWVKVDLGSFGRRPFFTFDIPERIPFDGVLGFDFFEDYKICLDFSNQTMYVKPAK